jgi:hypothetical protein
MAEESGLPLGYSNGPKTRRLSEAARLNQDLSRYIRRTAIAEILLREVLEASNNGESLALVLERVQHYFNNPEQYVKEAQQALISQGYPTVDGWLREDLSRLESLAAERGYQVQIEQGLIQLAPLHPQSGQKQARTTSFLYNLSGASLALAWLETQKSDGEPRTGDQEPERMKLDPFQGAYKGSVTIQQGRGKHAKTEQRIIAVQQARFEAELARLGQQQEQAHAPVYWMPKLRMYGEGAVYLVGDCPDWDYVLAEGTLVTPEQLVALFTQHPDASESLYYEVYDERLLTPEQARWMTEHHLSIQQILTGGTPADLEEEVRARIFAQWNAQLGAHVFG